MKNTYYELLIKYHKYMRDLFAKDSPFQNYMTVIHHDMRIQRYENKITSK